MEVVLTGVGSMMVPVIKVIREATGLGLKETKALVDDVPSVVREGLGELEAGNLKAKLEEAGATVELR